MNIDTVQTNTQDQEKHYLFNVINNISDCNTKCRGPEHVGVYVCNLFYFEDCTQ